MSEIPHETFFRLLDTLPPREQEEVLYRAAGHCHALRRQEEREHIKASPGTFLVAGVYTPDDSDWHFGEFDTLELARERVTAVSTKEEDFVLHVYDENGRIE